MYHSCLDLTEEHKFVTEHKFEKFWCSTDHVLKKNLLNSSNPVV